ncbi:MAG: hybrid sensor histidine kinase/response regulator [Achromobacter sp.]|jgi:signal transduction histidine kinase/CheY-like chemotaxis protein
MPKRKDAERSQAIVRLTLGGVAATYVLATAAISPVPSEGESFAILIGGFMLVAVALYASIVKWPGHYPARRIFGMVHDYAGISMTMILGGEPMLPVFGTLLWVTVGNGMRFGTRYLAIATTFAITALCTIAYLTPYWREQPHVVATLLITTMVVPAYAHMLLRQTRGAYEKVDEANFARSRFLAQASHDLRQPIHAISLFTACLRDARLGHEARRMVDNIDKSLHSVSQLFRSILDSYTLDNGQVEARAASTPVKTLLDAVAAQNTEVARWAGVTLRVRAGKQRVHVDPALLTTMVQNLVSNAIKYGPDRPVLIGTRMRRGLLSIEVHDQGRGISATHLPHVFEEFYRVRQVRDKDIEGVGLGLSIVRRIGALMGVSVAIRSHPGRGTVVTIDGLPVDQGPVSAPATASAPASASASAPLTGLRILLIEDDQNVLQATATLLRKWGCNVDTATTIPTADVDYDLVISDYDLNTDHSGADCIAYMRQLSGRKVPALLMTGHNVKQVEAALNDAGIPVLSKPVRPAELRAVLSALRVQLPSRA